MAIGNEILAYLRVVLPEDVFVESFCDVFPTDPIEYYVNLASIKDGINQEDSVSCVLVDLNEIFGWNRFLWFNK